MIYYINLSDADHMITDYIAGYYISLRPHEYNGRLSPNESESLNWKTLKRWPVLVDHYSKMLSLDRVFVASISLCQNDYELINIFIIGSPRGKT